MLTASERSLAGRVGGLTSWANTTDRSARTAPARAALDAKFLEQAGGDPERAAALRKAHFARLALKSAQSRRKAREAAEATSSSVEALVREAHRVLDAAGVRLSASKVTRLCRDYAAVAEHIAFDLYLANNAFLTEAQRSDVARVLSYADPTGETAVRNVMAGDA